GGGGGGVGGRDSRAPLAQRIEERPQGKSGAEAVGEGTPSSASLAAPTIDAPPIRPRYPPFPRHRYGQSASKSRISRAPGSLEMILEENFLLWGAFLFPVHLCLRQWTRACRRLCSPPPRPDFPPNIEFGFGVRENFRSHGCLDFLNKEVNFRFGVGFKFDYLRVASILHIEVN
ncbi:unnamed protein product, partial [Urochloa humidicola]